MPIPILVVDDEPNFQTLMQTALGKRGFIVNTISSGAEALTQLETLLFDFTLIDLKLTGESGIDVLGAIKQRQPRIHALVVTAYPTEEYFPGPFRSEGFRTGDAIDAPHFCLRATA
jgi:two-component system response regulator HydG